MKHRKALKSSVCGLGAALLLLTCLPAAAASGWQSADPKGQAQTVPNRQWLREKQDTAVSYYGPEEAGRPQYDRPPVFRPTWLPEGWALESAMPISEDNVLSRWTYCKGSARLDFTCYLRCDGYIGMALYDPYASGRPGRTKPAVKLQQAQVQGRGADFYQAGEKAYLVWEDGSGNLFVLKGALDRTSIVRVADSVKEVKDQALPEYRLGWEPEGPTIVRRAAMPGAVMLDVKKNMLPDYTNVPFYTVLYASEPLNVPEGKPEAVNIKDIDAQYWKGVQKDSPASPWPTQEELNTLLWTAPQTGITFRIQGVLDKDVMLRMAESLVLSAVEDLPPQKDTPTAKNPPAQTSAEPAMKLEDAKKLAYQNLEKATPEMQARILEARRLIINSTSWAADGCNTYMIDENGEKVSLPHFSELFPGWEMPAD